MLGKLHMPVKLFRKRNRLFNVCMNLSQNADCDFKRLSQLSSSVVDTWAIINSRCQITMLCVYVCVCTCVCVQLDSSTVTLSP